MGDKNEDPLQQEKSPKKHCSPRTKADLAKNTRPSKFLEGSMNDRVSHRPPSIYIKDGDATDELGIQSRSKSLTHESAGIDGPVAFHGAVIESTKPSGVYRIGRALINVFKPKSVWRGLGNTREERDANTLAHQSVMQERQLKAEKAYAELKKRGYKGTQQASHTVDNLAIPVIKIEPATDEPRNLSHRNLDIHGGRHCSSIEQEQNIRVVEPVGTPISPQAAPVAHRIMSPMSNGSSSRKSSLYFRKPSLHNLKKAKSQIQLPAIKKQVPPEPEAGSDKVMAEKHLRKQPSRRDIVRHKKLSRKVSDLEVQLAIARRNLKLSMNETPAELASQNHKDLRVFKPGALPSLPSERLLIKDPASIEGRAVYTTETDAVHGSHVDKQAVVPSAGDHELISQVDSSSQLGNKVVNRVKQPNTGSKRSREARHDHDSPPISEHIFVDEAKSNDTGSEPSNREFPSSSKTQEIIDMCVDACKISGQENRSLSTHSAPKMATKTVPPLPPIHSSSVRVSQAVPPLPAIQYAFDPSQVDSARLLSMRSIGDMKTPLGRHAEDLDNLRKEFPLASAQQLARYVTNLKESKVTDHTSLAHHNQAEAPPLARPRALSPIKIEPRKAPKNKKSALEVSHYNSNAILQAQNMNLMECTGLDATEFLKPSSQLSVHSLTPIAGEKKVETGKLLPIIQKEDYEWPDDVF